jgi:hypothetical protein
MILDQQSKHDEWRFRGRDAGFLFDLWMKD